MEEINPQVAIDFDRTMQDQIEDGRTEDSALGDSLERAIKDDLNQLPGQPFESNHVTIFRVPAWIKDGNPKLYEPKIVSIGPYHCFSERLGRRDYTDWDALEATELLKQYSLRDFLSRNPSVEISVYLKEMVRLESAARHCYSKDITLEQANFVRMLLLDGCFILEFYLKTAQGQLNPGWDTNAMISDFFLLENQIPFFVIHKLFVLHGGCPDANCSPKDTCPLLELIFKSPPFNYDSDKVSFKPPIIGNKIHHLFELFYRAKLPDHTSKETDLSRRGSFGFGFEEEISAKADIWTSTIPSATELHKARVRFKRMNNPRHAFDVTFHRGILKMPFFKLTGITKIILANMIAFEQSQLMGLEKRVFTSYVALIDSLINTERDVSILEKNGVFKNMLQSDKEAADFFNNLGAHVLLDYDNHYYSDLFKKLRHFSNSTWQKYKARLFHDFSTNPWTLISVLTGAVALVLTAIQTYFAAKP